MLQDGRKVSKACSGKRRQILHPRVLNSMQKVHWVLLCDFVTHIYVQGGLLYEHVQVTKYFSEPLNELLYGLNNTIVLVLLFSFMFVRQFVWLMFLCWKKFMITSLDMYELKILKLSVSFVAFSYIYTHASMIYCCYVCL